MPLNRWGFIPPWAPLLIMAAVIFTGVALGGVGAVFLVLFFIACIVSTALIELRALFLTVVAIPFYWFIGIGIIGYASDPDAFSGGGRKTAIITAVYPSIEKYLWMLAAFLVSLLIALVRQRLDAAARERAVRIARQRRQRNATAEKDNRRVNSMVRDLERTTQQAEQQAGEQAGEQARQQAAQQARQQVGGVADRQTRVPERTRTTPRVVRRPHRSAPDIGPNAGPATGEVRTRTAEELRAASERRRLREQNAGRGLGRDLGPDVDRPLDLP